jgi:hypothetical protein
MERGRREIREGRNMRKREEGRERGQSDRSGKREEQRIPSPHDCWDSEASSIVLHSEAAILLR